MSSGVPLTDVRGMRCGEWRCDGARRGERQKAGVRGHAGITGQGRGVRGHVGEKGRKKE